MIRVLTEVCLLFEERVADGRGQRQALNSLRRPFRPNLGAGNAPDLFRVGLEENLVQALAKAVADPLLQVLFVVVIGHSRPKIAEYNADGFDRSQAEERILGLQRVVKELLAIENPREAGPRQKLIAQNLVPHLIDFVPLGEETVPPDIEEISLVIDRARYASNGVVGLQNHSWDVMLRQLIGRRQPGRAGADDHNVTLLRGDEWHRIVL